MRRPLPLSVLLGVLLDAQILGIEMPQERLIRTILADFEGWQVRGEGVCWGCGGLWSLFWAALYLHVWGCTVLCGAVRVRRPCSPIHTPQPRAVPLGGSVLKEWKGGLITIPAATTPHRHTYGQGLCSTANVSTRHSFKPHQLCHLAVPVLLRYVVSCRRL